MLFTCLDVFNHTINSFLTLILQIGKHEVPVNCEAVACTAKNGSCKGAVQNLLIM